MEDSTGIAFYLHGVISCLRSIGIIPFVNSSKISKAFEVLGSSLLESVFKLQISDFQIDGEIWKVHFYATAFLDLGRSSVSSVVFVSIIVFIESSHILLKLLVLLG